MSFSITEFKANGLILGGARPTNFQVDIFVPFSSPNASRVKFLCRAASIPPAPLDAVPVPYFGRRIKVAGDRDFPDWTVTIMNDEDYAIRVMLENWSNKMNALISNKMDPAMFPTAYKSTATVTQFDRVGTTRRVYQFQGIFPTLVDQIPLDWDQTNTIEQFDVTFAYDLWVPDNSVSTGPDDYNPVLASDGIQS